VLLLIVAHADGSALFALAKTCKDLDSRLQPSIWKYNVKFQNSNLLHLATKDDNVGLAEALLQHNANINAFYRGKTPLMRALQYSSAAVRELLLKRQELDINIQNQARESALWYAIHYESFSTVKSVLDQPNISVHVKHEHGRTALHLAVFAGKIGFVHLLLSRGSNPDLQDDSGGSPWAWACHFNRPVMKIIISNNPDSDLFFRTQSSWDAQLPLHQAVSHGSIDAVERRLRRIDMALDAQDREGCTPLHLAVLSRRLEVVNLLLSHPRANVNCKDKDGNTPLWISTYFSCDEIAERLLAERDVDVNFVGGSGQFEPSTSLHHAAARLDTVLLLQLCAVPGINLNLCVGGYSPISVAACNGGMDTVTCLLNMGAVEINGRGLMDPPICRAVAHGHHDVVRLLVQQGTLLDINKRTIGSYDTALCIAARGGNLKIVQALLRHDQIDVNLRNRLIEDPLMLAVRGGHRSIVDALVTKPGHKSFSLKRSLELARDDCIQRAIQNRMEADNSRQTLLRRSPRMKFGGLYS
jgi:ankyrin repeat protein